MSRACTLTTAAFLCLGIVALSNVAKAADIKVASTPALASFYRQILPEFERTAGHHVVISYGSAGETRNRVQGGEIDVAISTVELIDDLQRQGKIITSSRVDIAKVGIGVAVRKGASKPDIRSVDAFKKSLLAARAIAHGDPAGGGAAGIYLAGMMERLGIAANMKPRTKLLNARGIAEAIARGEVEIGMTQISEIFSESSVEFVGPLPAAIQNYTLFASGVVANSKWPGAGKGLIRFITSPTAVAIMKSKGMEPGEMTELQ